MKYYWNWALDDGIKTLTPEHMFQQTKWLIVEIIWNDDLELVDDKLKYTAFCLNQIFTTRLWLRLHRLGWARSSHFDRPKGDDLAPSLSIEFVHTRGVDRPLFSPLGTRLSHDGWSRERKGSGWNWAKIHQDSEMSRSNKPVLRLSHW